MVFVDRLGSGLENRVDVLHDVIGRQAALGLAEIHRAAGGVKADPDGTGRLDLGRQEVAASGPGRPAASRASRWIDIVVIHRGRAARQRQPAEPGGCGRVHGLGIDPRPHRVELHQPFEERVVRCTPPGEPLIEMVMGVDQPGRGQAAAAVDDVRPVVRRGGAGPDGDQHTVLDDNVAVGVLGPGRVDGGHRAALDDGLRSLCLRGGTCVGTHLDELCRVAASRTASRIFS